MGGFSMPGVSPQQVHANALSGLSMPGGLAPQVHANALGSFNRVLSQHTRPKRAQGVGSVDRAPQGLSSRQQQALRVGPLRRRPCQPP